mgnify:CR=1 FL=1
MPIFMNQTSYSPDKFGTYLSHPGSQGCDIVRISPENFERYITFDED